MKTSLSLIFLLLMLIPVPECMAQITINQNDMPSPGDTIHYSHSIQLTMLDTANTGANSTWDYHKLHWMAQTGDSFLSFHDLPATVRFVFFGSANLAISQFPEGLDTLIPSGVLKGTVIYNNTSSSFSNTGFSLTYNQLPIPVKFSNPDEIYTFPLKYGNSDTTTAFYSFTVPGMLHLEQSISRIVKVDGYGTLTTPYGTFSTLRVKSIVHRSDSIYVDSLGTGIRTNQPAEVSYQWLAKGKGTSLLTYSGNYLNGHFVPTKLVYQDSARTNPNAGIQPAGSSVADFSIFPNPASEFLNIANSFQLPFTISVYNLSGKKLLSLKETAAAHCRVPLGSLSEATYLLIIQNEKELIVKKIVIQKP